MNISGRQLRIVSAREVIERADHFGLRVIIEAAPLAGTDKTAARVLVTHALLPGVKQELGLLFDEPDEPPSTLVAEDSAAALHKAAGALLTPIARRLRFEISASEVSVFGGETEVRVNTQASLH